MKKSNKDTKGMNRMSVPVVKNAKGITLKMTFKK